jgi:hypothetical protein
MKNLIQTQNEIIENIFNNKSQFTKLVNKVLNEYLPTELKEEFKNSTEEDKKAIMTHMILSTSFSVALELTK